MERLSSDICWLFKVARETNAAQALVVELLAEVDNPHSNFLQSATNEDGSPTLAVTQLKGLAGIIYAIFQDVLEGKLFQNSEQRVSLFHNWYWLLLEILLDLDEAHVSAVLVRFVTTLPQCHVDFFWSLTDVQPGQEFCGRRTGCGCRAWSPERRMCSNSNSQIRRRRLVARMRIRVWSSARMVIWFSIFKHLVHVALDMKTGKNLFRGMVGSLPQYGLLPVLRLIPRERRETDTAVQSRSHTHQN